jgi:hypothetical protein
MSKLDREARAVREQALAHPVTRAGGRVLPQIELPGGILIGLSVNK